MFGSIDWCFRMTTGRHVCFRNVLWNSRRDSFRTCPFRPESVKFSGTKDINKKQTRRFSVLKPQDEYTCFETTSSSSVTGNVRVCREFPDDVRLLRSISAFGLTTIGILKIGNYTYTFSDYEQLLSKFILYFYIVRY